MIIFWVTLLAVSILLYVLLDGFDLGVGMLFGLTGSECQSASNFDPRLECARGDGQIEGSGLTSCVGLSEDESHDQASFP